MLLSINLTHSIRCPNSSLILFPDKNLHCITFGLQFSASYWLKMSCPGSSHLRSIHHLRWGLLFLSEAGMRLVVASLSLAFPRTGKTLSHFPYPFTMKLSVPGKCKPFSLAAVRHRPTPPGLVPENLPESLPQCAQGQEPTQVFRAVASCSPRGRMGFLSTADLWHSACLASSQPWLWISLGKIKATGESSVWPSAV